MISWKPFIELLRDPVFQETSKSLIQADNGNTLSNPSHLWTLPMSRGNLQTT
jgi:hypothetical protein